MKVKPSCVIGVVPLQEQYFKLQDRGSYITVSIQVKEKSAKHKQGSGNQAPEFGFARTKHLPKGQFFKVWKNIYEVTT